MQDDAEFRKFATSVRALAGSLLRESEIVLTSSLGQDAKSEPALWSESEERNLAQLARMIYKARRARDSIAPGKNLFQDPAWDILLDLYIARCDDKTISVTSASMAAGVPMTTALRWVWQLEQLQLVARQVDTVDRRRSFVSLSDIGLRLVEEILADSFDRFRHLFNAPKLA